MDLSPIASAAVTAAAGLVGALATAGLALLPRLWTLMRVYMDGSDATRLRYAIANASVRALREIDEGSTQDSAIARMVQHCRDSMPQALARLGTPDATLQTMCEAELARLMAGRG
ncbi:hypothetical protein GXW78_25630 [Roseomonas terrae]|uniref:Uncharacterized protein n=1 Tax=Neoroseomonas terrae TaxID=424799 RepID=A0ABS5EPX1_9PROT|nr:hypothetical protein [Neoroseomonas terrae]MBR0653063.1 hypothetical protein [Neoroseomonas terrae]